MIDWKRVAELRDEIGAEGFIEVADMFLEEAEEAIKALLSELPADQIEGQLHFLKGSALNLGLADLAALCQDMERRAAAGDGPALEIAFLVHIYQRSRAELLAGIATDAAA